MNDPSTQTTATWNSIHEMKTAMGKKPARIKYLRSKRNPGVRVMIMPVYPINQDKMSIFIV